MVLGLTAVFTAWRVPRPILRGEKYRERFTVFYLWFIITLGNARAVFCAKHFRDHAGYPLIQSGLLGT